MFTELFTITKIWKKPKCPSTDEWLKKTLCVCVYIHIYIYIYIYTHIYMILEVRSSKAYIYICIYTHTHTHTRNGILAIKKNEILPFATIRMDLEGITLSEISQTEKDKHCMISLICGI